MIKLSVIIVNYNVRFFLEQCILSVQDACADMSSEIIVVDNNSTDGSQEMIKDKFPEVLLISNQENIGFSRANNIGVSKSSGDFILILNPDIILAEDTLLKVLDFVEKKNNFGALGVKMIDGTGKYLPESKRNIPTVKISSQKLRGITKNYYANHIDENENADVEVLTGAFMLMKRKIYIEIGGFDEDYFMYGEDVDLSYKLLNKGFKNFYFGNTTIIHYKGESTTKNIDYVKNFYGAMQIFYKKHFMRNQLDYFIQKMAVKLMIMLNFSKAKEKDIVKNEMKAIVIIGSRSKIYQKISRILKPDKIEIIKNILFDVSGFDTVFFDQNFLSNKEIIHLFKGKPLKNISKRIISKQSNFYFGSDSSVGKGEAVTF